MATVSYFFSSWTAGHGNDLPAGATHGWSMSGGGFDYGDAIMVSAHPIRRTGARRALAVENVRIESNDGSGSVLSFTVRNVGADSVIGYGLGFGWIDN